MDYVPAHGDKTKLDDRDETSGARVFDGEDQGKCIRWARLESLRVDFLERAVDAVFSIE